MFRTRVVGQRRGVSFLQNLIQKGRTPHSLLLFGPTGTGKAAAAIEMGRALHCEHGGGLGACESCKGCRKTKALNHPDFSVLFPMPARKELDANHALTQQVIEDPYGYPLPDEGHTISIERIRSIQKQFSYGAYEGKWRTSVILHADQMRPEAGNALLKTLEEPHDRCLLILTASNLEALLPTIVSRCQYLKFSQLSSQEVEAALISQEGGEAETARFVARACGGSFRRAREMVDGDFQEAQDRSYRFLHALIWGEEFPTYTALENLSRDRQAVWQVLEGAELWLRDVFLVLNENQEQVSHFKKGEEIRELSKAFDTETITRTFEMIEALREKSRRHVNLHLGLVSLWRSVRSHTASSA